MRALLIGESWGINELHYKHPFVGRSGQELARMVGEAGLCPKLMVECRNCKKQVPFGYCQCGQFNAVNFLQMVRFWAQTKNAGVGVANVFNAHPEKDNEQLFFGNKSTDDVCLDIPPFKIGSRNLYLLEENRYHLENLDNEIRTLQPNILIPLGNTACWAVLQRTMISKIRGTVTGTRFGIKAVPTYHPAALRDWTLRPTIVADLKKAAGESSSSLITRPKTWIFTNPGLEDIENWFTEPTARYSCDIESGLVLFSKAEVGNMRKRNPKAFNIMARLISMVGFARSEDQGLVIPFMYRDESGTLRNYWSEKWQEVRAWEWVQHGLGGTGAELVFQNGMYDINRLLCAGMRPRKMAHDTMLYHHAILPEMPKSLGFLDSIHRNDSPWKMMYGNESLKRDD